MAFKIVTTISEKIKADNLLIRQLQPLSAPDNASAITTETSLLPPPPPDNPTRSSPAPRGSAPLPTAPRKTGHIVNCSFNQVSQTRNQSLRSSPGDAWPPLPLHKAPL